MDELGKRAHKQLEVLMTFIAIVGLPLTEDKYVRKADLIKKSGGSQSALKSLLDKKFLSPSINLLVGSKMKQRMIVIINLN